MDLLIGIIASAIIFFQTQYFFISFGWALIHGVGASSFFAVWPFLAASVILWGGWTLLKYKAHKYRTLFSLVLSILVIVVVEIIMPMTPLKSHLQQQDIINVRVENISDEILLSASGKPIGSRLTYDVIFPRAGIYSIYPSLYTPINGMPELYPLQFGSSFNTTIKPEPDKSEAGKKSFKANIPYHFVFDLMPNFLRTDNSSKTYCIYLQPNNNYTDADVKSSIENSDKVRYKTFIQIDGPTSFTDRVVAKEYVTRNGYSLKDIYSSALREGVKSCQF